MFNEVSYKYKNKVKWKKKGNRNIIRRNVSHTRSKLSKNRHHWHTSTIHHRPRVRKQRRYITPKIRNKITRVASKNTKYDCWYFTKTSHHKTTMNNRTNILHFDSDSVRIGVDNHSSKSISFSSKDFIRPIKPCNGVLNGISGRIKIKGTGTVRWRILDDSGSVHAFKIKNFLYVPEAKIRLMSPQQWSKQSNDHFPRKNGTWCATYHDTCKLFWQQNKFTKTIKLDPNTNVAMMRTAPSYQKYDAFSSIHDKSHPIKCIETCICRPVTINNDESLNPDDNLFEINSSNLLEDQNDKIEGVNDMSEWMRWHYRLGHMSFRKIKLLCAMGFLPKKFLKLKTPKCAGCLYGSMTRKPWRTRNTSSVSSIHKSTKSGQCVSIDQMESSTPGFIAHTKGILTKHRYTSATIFVDHFSRLGYIHMQKSLSAEDTMAAKNAFEIFAK